MKEHRKKKIAPIIITIIMLIYFILYFLVMIKTLPVVMNVILGIVPLLACVGIIYVCHERLKEIDGGEEDDLSKY